jgi:catechol 2,3-dioxygenase-like lactoylglutathione lyase family enzyme
MAVHLFHYHLVTSKVRDVEARYIAKLGFRLVARYGRIGDEQTSYEAGVPWEELDRLGFRLRLSELERGAVNVVVQPGQWDLPRIDHVGFALDEDEYDEALERAQRMELRVQEYPGRRTFVATGAGYRVEIHPPRDWIEEILDESRTMRIAGLRLKSEDPAAQAAALARLLDAVMDEDTVQVGDAFVRFVEGGPPGRPQLDGELFA